VLSEIDRNELSEVTDGVSAKLSQLASPQVSQQARVAFDQTVQVKGSRSTIPFVEIEGPTGQH
jgi:hypothetical protein